MSKGTWLISALILVTCVVIGYLMYKKSITENPTNPDRKDTRPFIYKPLSINPNIISK